MINTITYSEMRAFKTCRLKHHLSYVEMLAPKAPSKHLRFGTAIHEGLRVLHADGLEAGLTAFNASLDMEYARLENDPDVEIWDEDRAEWDAERELGQTMLTHYIVFNENQEPLEIIASPVKYAVKLRTPTGHKGRTILAGELDAIVRDTEGNLFVREDKTAKDINGRFILKLDVDDQCNTYLWAAHELDYDVKGVIYNVLAKWVPHAPALLKSGKLSMDKKQRTTLGLYLQAIAENELTKDDYTEMLDLLEAKGDTTFLRQKVYRNADEIQRIGNELYMTARDMAHPNIYRCPAFCEVMGCSVRSLCIEDTPEARLNFRVKTSKHEELEVENDAA